MKNVRQRVIVLFATLAILNVSAWLTLFGVAHGVDSSAITAGALAYLFGLRHAFDADHIAAIDNVTRKLRQDGQRPVATGFFFALGHSTIVMLLSLGIILAVRLKGGSQLGLWGGVLSKVVSAGFLSLLAIINLVIFAQLGRAFSSGVTGSGDSDQFGDMVEALLHQRGMLGRLFGFLYRSIDASWKMFPVGFLFGLGFDTATEVAMLGISAAAAASGRFPVWGIMVFPLMFTAGMTLIDAIDGAIMMGVYDWAFAEPLKKLFFNTVITGLSALMALVVATIEWLQLVSAGLQLDRGVWRLVNALDFAQVGMIMVALLILTWVIALQRYRYYFRDTAQG